MPQHRDVRILPYTPAQMFDVVADIERYPEFLPWCQSLRVRSRSKQEDKEVLVAQMVVHYHGISERYTSRVILDRACRVIEAHHLEGPFEKLDNIWHFLPHERGCRVDFFIAFAFRSRLLSVMAGVAFDAAARRMAESFAQRAEALYGTSHRLEQ
jgi:coenzyme Q-binding protein COQ10